MELWIRNQDKNVLQKTNALFIANTDKNIFSIIDNVNMTKYGTYSTKERALEVLDEIQNYINNNCKFIEQKTHTKMGTYTNRIDTNVYEMPEE